MKVLLVGDFQYGSGMTVYMVNTYKQLTKDGIKVDCLSYSGKHDFEKETIALGWKMNYVTRVGKNPVKHWRDWARFCKDNSHSYDIIHFNYSSSWNFMPVVFAHWFTNAKLVVQSHNTDYSNPINSRLVKYAIDIVNKLGRHVLSKIADLKIGVSNESLQWMFGNATQGIVLKNGIDLSLFSFSQRSRSELRQSLGLSNSTMVVGMVGVLTERKNPFFSLRLFDQLHSINPDSYLVIIGRGGLRERLDQEVRQRKLSSCVSFISHTNIMNEWYSALDVLLFPSLFEGFGFVPLEAQASGLRVLASDQIPNDVMLTSSIVKLPLSLPKEWMNDLSLHFAESPLARSLTSEKNIKSIDTAGYSIRTSARVLRKMFRELLTAKVGKKQ